MIELDLIEVVGVANLGNPRRRIRTRRELATVHCFHWAFDVLHNTNTTTALRIDLDILKPPPKERERAAHRDDDQLTFCNRYLSSTRRARSSVDASRVFSSGLCDSNVLSMSH